MFRLFLLGWPQPKVKGLRNPVPPVSDGGKGCRGHLDLVCAAELPKVKQFYVFFYLFWSKLSEHELPHQRLIPN